MRPELTIRKPVAGRLAIVAALVAFAAGSPAHGQALAPEFGLPGARGGRLDRFGDPLPAGAVARLGTLRLQHGGRVWSVDFSRDGKLLASCNGEGLDSERRDVKAHLWDVATGREDHRVVPAYGGIAPLPDGTSVLFGGEEGVYVRDLATGRTLYELAIQSRTFTLLGDGRTVAAPDGLTLQLWDLATRRALRTIKLPDYSYLAFSPDGRHAAVTAEGSLRLIDLVTGGDSEFTTEPEYAPWAVAYAPDSKSLAVCNAAGGITVWDTTTRKPRFRLCDRWTAPFIAVRYSPDGRRLATADYFGGPVLIWDVSPGSRARTCDALPDRFNCLAFAPDGKTLAVAGDSGRIQLIDADSGKLRMPFEQPPDVGGDVVFRGDGISILTTTTFGGPPRGGAAVVWDAATGMNRSGFKCYRSSGHIEVAADGSALLVRESGGKDISLFTVATGASRKLSGDHGGRAFAISGDGKRVATTAPGNRDVRVWDAATGKQLRHFPKFPGPTRLALSPDGTTLVAASLKAGTLWDEDFQIGETRDRAIRALDVATGRELWKFADARSQDFAFSPDGRWLGTTGQLPDEDGTNRVSTELRLWDAATGRQAWMAEKHKGYVRAFAFSPDARTLATGWREGEVCLLEAASGLERLTFRAHPANIVALSFSADGNRLVSGGDEHTALVWDLSELPTRHDDPAAAWDALAADDGRQAFAAICQLAADPARAVPLLRSHLRPAAAVDARTIPKRIADLDSDAFAVRAAAERELAAISDVARAAVRQALAAGGSKERQRCLRRLIEQADGYTAEQLREWRALEVLERIGTPDARQVLAAVAAGRPTARLTAEAKASLRRLAGRPTMP